MTMGEYRDYIKTKDEPKLNLSWRERRQRAELSNLTIVGRLFAVILPIILFYLPILFIPPSYVDVETYGFLSATMVGSAFWMFTLFAFMMTLMAALIIVPLIMWIINGEHDTEYVFGPTRIVLKKFGIAYKIVFGDYEYKWDNLYYYLHPDKKAKILLNGFSDD